MTKNELDSWIRCQTNTFYSGGAAGADRLFTLYAIENGFECINFSFSKHVHYVPEETVLRIPADILGDNEIYNELVRASRNLSKKVPQKNTYVYNLLARNSYQIFSTERIYCISTLVSPNTVSGGTSWAVQMLINKEEHPEIYLYDYYDKCVYSYDSVLKQFTEVFFVPTPHGNWTGIGSRNAEPKHLEHFKTFFKD